MPLRPVSTGPGYPRPVGAAARREWHQFCAAYGVDPDDLPGLPVLRQMRELRTLVPYIRSTGKPEVQALPDLVGRPHAAKRQVRGGMDRARPR